MCRGIIESAALHHKALKIVGRYPPYAFTRETIRVPTYVFITCNTRLQNERTLVKKNR